MAGQYYIVPEIAKSNRKISVPIAAAHAVDNVGTIALVDAAKAAGVKKVVMVSSILTNGRAWGQENSPGFQVINR